MKMPPSGTTSWVVKYWPAMWVTSYCMPRFHSSQFSPSHGYDRPESSSKIRTVPGANVGPAGTGSDGTGRSAVVVVSFDLPTTTPITRTTISATTDSPTTGPVGNDRGDVGGTDGAAGSGRAGGARTGDCWTATPGPAGVVTSDHRTPSH